MQLQLCLLWLLLKEMHMKVFLVRAGKLSATLDYAIHLLIDKTAEQVRMRFGLRHRPDSGLTPDFEVNGNSYQVVAEQFFTYRELRNNRGWSDRQSFMTGYRWAEKRLIDPLPLYVYTLSTRFTAPEAAGHVWNGNFLTGFNVPFADSPFDECFVTVNLHPTLGGCLVEGVDPLNVEQTDYQSSAQVREMQFPDLRVTAPTSLKAGDPAVFTVHMLDGIGEVSTRDAEVFLESVNGYLPISRRQTQGGITTATVLTTGLAAGDTVRLKAGFKFYPGCADAQVTLS